MSIWAGASGILPENLLYGGIVSPVAPSFVDNGDGTATIGNTLASLYSNSNFEGLLRTYSVSGTTLGFTNGAQQYVCISYNSGSPVFYVENNRLLINGSDVILVFAVWRQDNVLHSADQDSVGLGLPNKINARLLNTAPYAVATTGGLVISEIITPIPRTVVVTEAIVYRGTASGLVSTFNSSTDLLTKAIKTGSGWVYTDELQYDNLNYNPDSSGEVVMTNNRYTYRLFFRSIGDVKQVFYVEAPEQYTSVVDARAGSEIGRNDLPLLLTGHCLLVGRAIIQKGATSGIMEPFTRSGGTFISGGGIPEAPVDGKIYGRQNAGWTEVTGGDVAQLALIVDFVGDYVYKGEATPGSLTSAASWRISRYYINPSDGDITTTWANGNANFENVWNNHLTLTYS